MYGTVVGMEIGDGLMTSAKTRHVAQWSPDAAADGQGAWRVSWLPLRLLTREQAVTAMMLAEMVGQKGAALDDRARPLVESWARELHLPASEAITRITGK